MPVHTCVVGSELFVKPVKFYLKAFTITHGVAARL